MHPVSNIDAVHYLSARTIATAVAAGRIRASAVVTAHLRRIAAVNSAINALVQVTGEEALKAAVAADAKVARGDPLGPLHGVPFTVKDVIDVEGVVGAAGLADRASYMPARDAVVVARMKAAGAILLGKTNCPPGGGGGETDNPVYGRTRNPTLGVQPGGSSGGEAAAVAAGLSAIGVGSDSGGSLRLPAHFCGIATLKPTVGRVPNTGVLNHPGGLSDVRSQIGVLGRTVADVALAWSLLAGVDNCEAVSCRCRCHRPDLPLSPACASRSTPATALPRRHPKRFWPFMLPATRCGQLASSRTCVPPLPRRCRVDHARYWAMDDLSGREVRQLLADSQYLRTRQLAFISAFDAIVCPTDAGPAHRSGAPRPTLFSYTLPFSLCGWPAAVIRVAADGNGLPIGVQITARPWHEHIALALAARLEAKFGGWQAPQGI